MCEIDPAPARILAHHHPDVPNLGDITAVRWADVERVDVITGGFPCQDLSLAGGRAGLRDGTRSGLWSHMAAAIDQLRPRLVVIENVRGILSASAHSDVEPCPWCLGDDTGEPALRALGAVLADLASLGYDAAWCGLRAADVGAPHGRYRVFIAAWPATDADHGGWEGRAGQLGTGRRGEPADRGGRPAPDADHPGHEGPEPTAGRDMPARGTAAHPDRSGRRADVGDVPARERDARGGAVPDAASDGRDEGRPEPAGELGRPDAALGGAGAAPDPDGGGRQGEREARGSDLPGGDADGRHGSPSGLDWGAYAAAVERWEHVLGRVAPAPTERAPKGGQRLAPVFVEWMMGLPAGWVTAVPGITRNEQLKALGNGVVPQQAEVAVRRLLTVRAQAIGTDLREVA